MNRVTRYGIRTATVSAVPMRNMLEMLVSVVIGTSQSIAIEKNTRATSRLKSLSAKIRRTHPSIQSIHHMIGYCSPTRKIPVRASSRNTVECMSLYRDIRQV